MRTFSEAAGARKTVVDDVIRKSKSEGESSCFRIAFGRCESPIEQAFCLELFHIPGVWAIEGDFGPQLLGKLWGGSEPRIFVFAQQPIAPYRADFLLLGLSPRSAEPAFVIVECDGLEWHSTREQMGKKRNGSPSRRRIGKGVWLLHWRRATNAKHQYALLARRTKSINRRAQNHDHQQI